MQETFFARTSAFLLGARSRWGEFLEEAKTSENAKFRLVGIVGAGLLGVLAVAMGFSLLGAVFGIPAFSPVLGAFFSRSYGILAFCIPAYLGYSAFILAHPQWQPAKFFLLNMLIIPFLTMGIGFILMRDFDGLAMQSALLGFIGRTGFGILIVILVFMQIILIQLLKEVFFPVKAVPRKRRVWKLREQALLLPAPSGETGENFADEPVLGEWVGIRSAETFARTFSSGDAGFGKVELNLPPARPLRSPIALDYLKPVKPELGNGSDKPGDSFGQIPKSKTSENNFIIDDIVNNITAGDNENNNTKNIIANVTDNFNINDIIDDEIPDDVTNDIDIDYLNNNNTKRAKILGDGLSDSVKRAIEEAEMSAAIQSANNVKPQVKASRPRTYSVPVDILNQYPDGEYWVIDQATRDAAITLTKTLQEFKIQAEVTGIRKGPVITMFEILPAPGVKLSRIANLQDNIALRLAASSIRIVAPIPGKHAVGIEVPNTKRNIVSFREIIEGELRREGKCPEIPVVMGKDITGEAQTIDLTQTPHLLIAGATGAGKSVCVNSMILSILYRLTPADCRLILIDPKIVELKLYNDIPHLLTPVITEPKRAFQALQYCIFEMERRYACLDSVGVRDIRSYNKRIKERDIAQEKMPYIVIIIDEFADLMATTGKELESTVARLAAMSRAVGIHLVLATQRPSIDVITGLIKANIPSRIAFMVASKMDSRIIIDMVGAEKLLGKGDMLYSGVVDPFPTRMQGAFVSEEEVEAVVAHVKTLGEPDYIDDEMFFDEDEESAEPAFLSEGDDPLYEKALEIVMQQGKASASYIQRRLKVGYNRAARLVEIMEHRGVVGPAQGSKPRELLRGM
ncbi:MAG: DNA translocase FtsK [Treponema sp.]|nr:DNA translocase FtsK [Treponema sp.]